MRVAPKRVVIPQPPTDHAGKAREFDRLLAVVAVADDNSWAARDVERPQVLLYSWCETIRPDMAFVSAPIMTSGIPHSQGIVLSRLLLRARHNRALGFRCQAP